MDLIDRQAAIKTLEKGLPNEPLKSKYTEGITVGFGLAITWIEQLPAVQPEPKPDKNGSEPFGNAEMLSDRTTDDCISRQAAIEIADAIWMVTGDKNVAKVWDQIKDLPSAQPQPEEDCDTCKHGYFGDRQCDNCRVRYLSHYERRTDGSD